MCGIAGYIAQPGRDLSAYAPAVLRCLEHRGPDDRGWLRIGQGTVQRGREWTRPDWEPEVVFLHRRLSILDISDRGWQPMSTPDERYHLLYNGEIYNYRELCEELKQHGHNFRSGSDTEVLLASYAQWGIQALQRLVGMFAFALLDRERGTVLLARDFLGIKPLYYVHEDGLFCFGSEIKALLNFGLCRPEANAERLMLYLRYGVTDFGAQTLLSQVKQLPAAHYLEIPIGDPRRNAPQPYWRLESNDVLDISFDEAASRVRELFLRSVELHLRSDVPVGAALSGGIDSSSIVMAIRHLRSDAEIHAFSYVADDKKLCEEKWVDLVGRVARAQVHKVRVTAGELAADFETMMHFHDEPCDGGSVYAQYAVFRAARATGVTVMLDGQGADELLGGYRHYLGARLASLVRQRRWQEALRFFDSCSHLDNFGAFRALAVCADHLLPPALQSPARKLIGRDALPAWLNRSWFRSRGVQPVFLSYAAAKHMLRHSLTRSLSDTLPKLLRYEDRNSMAFSVESRVPFLVPELVSFLHCLPEEYIITSDGTTKAVFREAMRGIVPDAILRRRDKIGFAVPERGWLNRLDHWVRRALDSETANSIPCLSLPKARQEWELVRDGRRPFDSRVWRWLDLIRWTADLSVVYN